MRMARIGRFAAAALVVLALGWLVIRSFARRNAAELPEPAIPESAPPPPHAEEVPRTPDPPSSGSDRGHAQEAVSSRKLTFVVSAVSGLPIPRCQARIGSMSLGPGNQPGTFRLHISTLEQTLEVEAPGYRPQTRMVPAGTDPLDLGRIELRGEVRRQVRVVDERGMPVEGAEVLAIDAFTPIRSTKALEAGFFLLGKTGSSGTLEVEPGPGACWLYATRESRRSELALVKTGKDSMDLLLPAEPNVRLHLVDEQGLPVAAVKLSLRFGGFFATHKLPLTVEGTSDDSGDVALSVPRGEYHVILEDRLWRAQDDDRGVRVAASRVERVVHLERLDGLSVRVVDAATQEPIERFALIVLPGNITRPPIRLGIDDRRVRNRPGGIARWPISWVDASSLGIRVSVKARGYRQSNVFVASASSEVVCVELERVATLRLRFVNRRAEPIPGLAVRIRSDREVRAGSGSRAASVWDFGRTDSSGTWESLGWEDGPAAIDASYDGDLHFVATTLTLPAESSEVVVLIDDTGSVEGRILGARPDLADVVLCDVEGTLLPAERRGDTFRIDRIPPGTYRLGSRAQLSRWFYASYHGFDLGTEVEVRPGAVTRMDVTLENGGSLVLRGRVRGLDPAWRHWLALVPPPASASGGYQTAFFVESEPRWLLGEDGAFLAPSVAPGEAVACVLTDVEGGTVLSLCRQVRLEADRDLELQWDPGFLEVEPGVAPQRLMLDWMGEPRARFRTASDLSSRIPLAPGAFDVNHGRLALDVVAGRTRVLRRAEVE